MYLAWKDDKIFNKVLFILLITFMIILITISPCFASFDFTYNETDYSLPDYEDILSNIKNDNNYNEIAYVIGYGSINSSIGSKFKLFIFNKDISSYSNIYLKPSSSSGDQFVYLYGDDVSLTCYGYTYYYDNNSWVQFGDKYTAYRFPYYDLIYSSHDIYKYDNSLHFPASSNTSGVVSPNFITTEGELASGKFDILKIDAGSLDTSEDSFIFNIYDSYNMGDGVYSDYIKKSFLLDIDSSFFKVADLNVYYYIPQSSLGIDLSNGKRYTFELKAKGSDEIYSSVTFQVGGLTTDEEIKNKEDEQTDAIRENTETNKGIWETIKDIVSYINPFSENFFVYKLIELLVDALKSLFIPSDGFFDTYFTDLKDWFSERLGFLFYPFELLIDILNKILNVNFSEPIFNIPDISEPFTNKKLINATTFNFNDLLSNSILNTVHSIYLICVDAFIVFELVNLFRRKYEEVTTK